MVDGGCLSDWIFDQ